ncbi:MAG: DUF4349 domain-containing protein [Chitinophagaceae bacterium]
MKHSLLYAAGLCFALLGCNSAYSPVNEKNQVTADYKSGPNADGNVTVDTLIVGNGSSTAALENLKDRDHKFIRTADVKFKVKNVEKTTYTIEDIVTGHGGFVTSTTMNSTIDNVASIPVSADSSLEATSFTVANIMTLRVPNTSLDTTLKDIARLVDYLDYRIIKADDISLQLQSNELAQTRLATNSQRLAQAIDSHGKKLVEATNAAESLLEKQEKADDAQLTNMSLNDQMKYSTVQLSIYQRQAIKRELISNDKNITAYQPGIGSRLLDSLQSGLEVLTIIIVALTKLWWVILFAIIGWTVCRKYGFKFGK